MKGFVDLLGAFGLLRLVVYFLGFVLLLVLFTLFIFGRCCQLWFVYVVNIGCGVIFVCFCFMSFVHWFVNCLGVVLCFWSYRLLVSLILFRLLILFALLRLLMFFCFVAEFACVGWCVF